MVKNDKSESSLPDKAVEPAAIQPSSTPPNAAGSKPSKKNSKRKSLPRSPVEAVPTSEKLGFPIVGIGASAGGLEAFKRFFSKMPADSGAAFVLVPHLDPTHKSLMVELLSVQTNMKVCEAKDSMPIEPNHVYVIPQNKYLAIADGKLKLSEPAERFGQPTAIDFFFRSLAVEQRERSIGIVLSGTSNHGTLGLKEIKLAGGLVIVQAPETAEHDAMPRNAIAAGVVDFVLAPEEMPEKLVKYVQHPYVRKPIEQTAGQVTREQLARILALLKAGTKYDFRSYRKKMLIRRVLRRMGLCHIETTADYLDYLRDTPDEVLLLYQDLLIGVTDFFRDLEAFQVLQQRVIPDLIQAHPDSIRVWIPGCATGEEAYSIAMLFMEQMATGEKVPNLQIFATDIDERSLEIARQGIYSENAIAGVTPDRLAKFFTKLDPLRWQVHKRLRSVITFAQQNLISDAPFSKLHLITCRNLLIYLEPEVQVKVIRLFHFALAEGGFLLLGPSETIGRALDLFETVSRKWRVFRRVGATKHELVEIPIVSTDEHRRFIATAAPSTPTPSIGFKELIQRMVLNDYTPAAALINQKFEIVSVLGPLVNYLEFPPGEITNDLLAMARPGLRIKLRAAIHKAFHSHEVVTDHAARVKREGSYVNCSITVKPVSEPKDAAGLLLVTFQDRESFNAGDAEQGKSRPADEDHTQLIRDLEQELKSVREDLQGTIEEYESSGEELKASNEEVMSMNEELQSANEELETSKEELQSLNEELSTVNSQLQEKIEELDRSSNDLLNLMNSSEVATLFLDRDFDIKRFTPPVAKLLNLRDTDSGRPFADFAPKFKDESLLDDCREVLRSLVPKEKEVWAKDDGATIENHLSTPLNSKFRCYLRRILPYRSVDNRIDGVVINFVDITKLIAAEALSRRLTAVLWDSNDAVTVHDFEGHYTAWNRGAERMYGYSEAEALKMTVCDIVQVEKRADALSYVERLRKNEAVPAFETQKICKDGRVLDIELTVTAYRDEHGHPIGVSTTERDITERNRLALALKIANKTLEKRVAEQTSEVKLLAKAISHLGEGVVITNAELDPPGPKVLFVNDAMSRMSGYSVEEMVGTTPRLLQGEHTDSEELTHLRKEVLAGRSCVAELINYRKDGSPYDAELFITPLFDDQGCRTHFVSIQRDVTERKRIARTLYESEHRMQAILNTAADAIVTIDKRGIITSINPATERMFDYSREELIGKNVNILMPSPYHEEHDEYIASFERTREPKIIGIGRELVGQRKDGSTFPVDVAVSEVDHLGLFTGIVRDISNRKILELQVLEIAADEQRRIGQELHDGTGQELTGLSLFAGTLVELLNKPPSASSDGTPILSFDESEVQRLRQTASKLLKAMVEANQHVQQLARGIMPVQIEVEGLRSALEDLAAATNANPQVSCSFECPQPVAVANNTTATHLYRIAQEAVNNALRHSHATQIEISLSQIDAEVKLEVSDNGIGFEPGSPRVSPAARRTSGFGLGIMGHRAGIIGGTLRMVRLEDGGTLVRCTAPRVGLTQGDEA